MIKKFLCFLFILFLLVHLCSALGTMIAPARSSLSISGSETNCTVIYVLPDKNTIIETKWSKNQSEKIEDYNLKENNVKIGVNWTRLETGKYKICFRANKEGIFYGAIMFLSQDSLIRIGSWVEIRVEKQNTLKRILITGNSIGFYKETNFWLAIILILLIIIFTLVIRRFFKSLKNKHS